MFEWDGYGEVRKRLELVEGYDDDDRGLGGRSVHNRGLYSGMTDLILDLL